MNASIATQKTLFGAPSTLQFAIRPRTKSQIKCRVTEPKEVADLATGIAISTSLLAAAPVQAAQEVAQLAAQDNRLGAVAFLFVPAIAWVLFNILGPASRQLDAMSARKPKPVTPRSAGRAPAARKSPVKKPPAKKAPARKAPVKRAPIKKKPVLAKKR